MKIVAFSLLILIDVNFGLEHPPPTYQQGEPSYVPQTDINLNQQYATESYVQPQTEQNIAYHGQEVIQSTQPAYGDYPAQNRQENVQYDNQVYSENNVVKQDVANNQKYAAFSYPSPQNLYQDIGPNPVQTGVKNAPSNGYKVREIQSEDLPNPVSYLQSDDDYYSSGFGHPFHFAPHNAPPQQNVAPQQVQQYQNAYNVFTDSVENPSNTALNAYRPPQQAFMNSGL